MATISNNKVSYEPEVIVLPSFEANWNWPRSVNPHLADVDEECEGWAASFGAFSPGAQKAMARCRFSMSNCDFNFFSL